MPKIGEILRNKNDGRIVKIVNITRGGKFGSRTFYHLSSYDPHTGEVDPNWTAVAWNRYTERDWEKYEPDESGGGMAVSSTTMSGSDDKITDAEKYSKPMMYDDDSPMTPERKPRSVGPPRPPPMELVAQAEMEDPARHLPSRWRVVRVVHWHLPFRFDVEVNSEFILVEVYNFSRFKIKYRDGNNHIREAVLDRDLFEDGTFHKEAWIGLYQLVDSDIPNNLSWQRNQSRAEMFRDLGFLEDKINIRF
jgi:hypothetical protein